MILIQVMIDSGIYSVSYAIDTYNLNYAKYKSARALYMQSNVLVVKPKQYCG